MTGLGAGLVIRQVDIMKISVPVTLTFISSLNWHIQRNCQRSFTLNTIFSMIDLTQEAFVCPKCMHSFDDCKDYPAYHNRTRWICPHCGYDGDSIEFQTSYKGHPVHKKNM